MFDETQAKISIVLATIKDYESHLNRNLPEDVLCMIRNKLDNEKEILRQLKIKHPEYFI